MTDVSRCGHAFFVSLKFCNPLLARNFSKYTKSIFGFRSLCDGKGVRVHHFAHSWFDADGRYTQGVRPEASSLLRKNR